MRRIPILLLTIAVAVAVGVASHRPLFAAGFTSGGGGGGGVIPLGSWSQATWCIDPANASGCASDANATGSLCTCGTSGDGPVQHYAQVAARWGTYSPRLRQATTLDFLSSQTDNTDPVIVRPYVENNGDIVIKCELPTPSQTGTLSAVVSKNRATPQLLNVTIGAGAVANQMIVNTTHPSRAFLDVNTGGNSWNVSQPLAPLTPPLGGSPGETEVDTWAVGDAYAVYSLSSVFVPDFEAAQVDGNAVFGPPGYYWQCNGLSPDNTNVMQLSFGINVLESSLHALISVTSGPLEYQTTFTNVAMPVLVAGTTDVYTTSSYSPAIIIRGGIAWAVIRTPFQARSDAILRYPSVIGTAGAYLNQAYIETGMTLGVSGISQVAGIVWGPGTLNIQGPGRLNYPTGAGAAAANLLLTGGVKINGGTTACSHTSATPDVVSCGITVTAAHLDAAQGAAGFGGLAYSPGGGSISNGGL
jgi:hypothetical protein